MKLPFKKARRKKKYKWLYKLRNYNSITRAGITANPLEMYNPVSLTTVPNNTLVKHNGLDFVGGDTDTFEYDFFTKVAGSSVECPCIMYFTQTNTGLLTPSNITGNAFTGWQEEPTQSNYDLIKTQDGSSLIINRSLNGQFNQRMVEVDLTPLANAVGGNNSLKNLLKSINCDVWAMGSGSNGGVATNGVQLQCWKGSWGLWSGSVLSTITKINSSTSSNIYIDTQNKVYFLINSQYSSDGTIPSSVSLDYLKVTVQLSRVPDTVSPISVNLPRYFACVVKGFSPMWDNNGATINNTILSISKDSNNYYRLYWAYATKQFALSKTVNGVTTYLTLNSPTFLKNQVYDFVIGQNSSGMFIYALKNNGIFEKNTNSNIELIQGNSNIYILMHYTGSFQASSFLDNLTLIDLEKLGKVKFGQELIVNGDFSNGGTGWTISSGAWNFSGGIATLTASTNGDNIFQDIFSVLPNTNYRITSDIIGTNTNVTIGFFNGSTWLSETYITAGNSQLNFTTPNNTTKMRVLLRNITVTTGTFTFDNISLKQVLSDGFTDDEAESILRGDDRYYVTSKADFVGKVSGSTVANPHIAKLVGYGNNPSNSLLTPSNNAWCELTGSNLTNITTLNGSLTNAQGLSNDGIPANSVGLIPQALFSFDVIAHLERKYGTLPCPQDLASKIAWAKANIKNINANWYGYGSCPVGTGNSVNGYYARIWRWNSNLNAWGGDYEWQGSAVNKCYTTAYISDNIDSNGFYHLLAMTYASNGTTPSTIYTDYVNIDVNCKIALTNPNMPNPELFDINKVTLHSNANLNNGVITLNATAGYQKNTLKISVLPNNRYNIKTNSTQSGGRSSWRGLCYYNNINLGTKVFESNLDTISNIDFVTPNNCNYIVVELDSISAGTFTYSNISLKRKD